MNVMADPLVTPYPVKVTRGPSGAQIRVTGGGRATIHQGVLRSAVGRYHTGIVGNRNTIFKSVLWFLGACKIHTNLIDNHFQFCTIF